MTDFVRVSFALCKGSWALGSACGQCSRCLSTATEAAKIIRDLSSRLRAETPSRSEWFALSQHLKAMEKEAADAGNYDGAKRYQTRAAEVERMVNPGASIS